MRSLRRLTESCRSNPHSTWLLAVILSVGTAVAVSCGSPRKSSEVDAPPSDPQSNVQAETGGDNAPQETAPPATSPEGRQPEMEPRHVEDLLAPKPDLGPRDYDDGLTDASPTEDEENPQRQ